jgi:hypothetical protein
MLIRGGFLFVLYCHGAVALYKPYSMTLAEPWYISRVKEKKLLKRLKTAG